MNSEIKQIKNSDCNTYKIPESQIHGAKKRQLPCRFSSNGNRLTSIDKKMEMKPGKLLML